MAIYVPAPLAHKAEHFSRCFLGSPARQIKWSISNCHLCVVDLQVQGLPFAVVLQRTAAFYFLGKEHGNPSQVIHTIRKNTGRREEARNPSPLPCQKVGPVGKRGGEMEEHTHLLYPSFFGFSCEPRSSSQIREQDRGTFLFTNLFYCVCFIFQTPLLQLSPPLTKKRKN